MIKRIIILTTFLLVVLLQTSCYISYEKPYGIWQSEDNSIWLDINPEDHGPHSGTFLKENGEVVNLEILFGYDRKINLFDKENDENGFTISYFTRPFKVKNGKLYYGKKGDDDIIIFNKIKEYEVP